MSTTTVWNVDHLMSATEIAKLIGTSRQYVDKLTRTDPNFPQPVAVLSGIRVFETDAVTKWARAAGKIK
jgi:predicted DNA-binding transcriptional regulator AlpA